MELTPSTIFKNVFKVLQTLQPETFTG